ncbi:uncharacterized protein LOC110454495 [Mizuhopecten yessoensis]|uniref:Ig-like domain-containing protein n=1 Tax=Mizuhopecten yessoensis TaxID=6573 RepID=A0A210QFC0_MIZYE|nr:uncharacterized protein LOC110454495 [Mizuhopecten yessoensis]XP_021359685.1 uncharacterized protein LOC110454495 [Mizuhopecten yessoensis]OWF47321.1 hypothetical protein KP79_PYT22619 [Mizuhopecten yessoensis]
MRATMTSLQVREPLTSLLVICVIMWTLTSCTARGPICMQCHNVTNNSNCSGITMCPEGEGCYAREIVRVTGSVVVERGCLSHKDCSILQSTAVGIGKRDATGCYRCCTRDLCNEHICDLGQISTPPPNSFLTTATSGNVTQNLRSCFRCSDATKVTDCQVSLACAAGQECYTTRATLGTTTHYSMGCESRQACTHYTGVASNQAPFCKRCCDADGCNVDLCGLHLLPEIVTKPFNRTLEVDDVTRLRCEADQSSNATLTWTFESATGTSVFPKPVAFGPRNTTAFFQITHNHFGKWTCIATNSFGSTSASAFIKHLSSS